MELIINVMSLFVGIALWMYGRYWRKTCGKVLCQYAAACGEREDREKLMRYAIIAGNPHAPLLYALTYPELFDKARPLRLFAFGEIRCVFAGYYFPQRFESWLCDDQSAFVQEVYDFKDGKDDCTEYFSQAFRILSTDRDVTAMFMPCSTSYRYYRRFSGIAGFLETHGYARSGLDLICITESRECKHTSEKRSEINTANYMMSNALYGKRVVIVDDLLTSGTSLLEYAHNLERAGAKVEGAVFLARTFQMPSPARVKRLVWKRHLLARIWRKQAGYFL
jgi:hypothetical protein